MTIAHGMNLTCPACQTRYCVDDAAIGPSGRTVRCANCGHVWHYSPEGGAEAAAVGSAAPAALAQTADAVAPVAPAAPRVEPPSEAGTSAPLPAPVVPPRPAEPVARSRRRPSAGLGWAALILVIAAIIAAIVAREGIVAMWPGAARIYALAHFGGEQPGTGLEIKVVPSRSADSLVIDGDITNTAGTTRTVPRLRVALRDINKNELDSKVIDPPVDRILPGAVAHFTTSFDHPNPNAAGVAVTFASQ